MNRHFWRPALALLAAAPLGCNPIAGLNEASERATSAGTSGAEADGGSRQRAAAGSPGHAEQEGGGGAAQPIPGRHSGGSYSLGNGGVRENGEPPEAGAGRAEPGNSAGAPSGETGGTATAAAAGSGGRLRADAGSSGVVGAGAGGSVDGAHGAHAGTGAASADAGATGTGGLPDPCPGGCLIGGDCYADDAPNPQNPCKTCDTFANRTVWTAANGAACDDSTYCNGADTCLGGQCVHAGSPCAEGVACRESDALCCAPNASLVCGDDGNVHNADACGTVGPVATVCPGDCVDTACRCVVHVNGEGGLDANDGQTWPTATRGLQVAMDAAFDRGGCEVWVRAGRYTAGKTRDSAFQLRSGVAVFGGFSGSETQRSARDVTANATVLSGDVPTVPTPNAKNDDAYHVVLGADDAILDGFTITSGNANGAASRGLSCGGGMLNSGVSPTIRSCTFTSNQANGRGGGMCNLDASPHIEDCTFSDNLARDGGGAIHMTEASPVIANSDFSNNTGFPGGAIDMTGGTPYIASSRFTGNSSSKNAGGFGGAIHALGSAPVIVNSLFAGNTARVGRAEGGIGGAVAAEGGGAILVNCTFFANVAEPPDSQGGAVFMDSESLGTIQNSIFFANSASVGPDAYRVDGAPVSYSVVRPPYHCTIAGTCLEISPLFMDATAGDFTPQNAQCVDSADVLALPADTADLDADGDRTEAVPLDIDATARVKGLGLDRGAVEAQ